jgi:hypothetical protein
VSRRGWAAALIVAVGLLAVSFALLRISWYAHHALTDVGTYRGYRDSIGAGLVPYRDFDVVYPPASLAAFLAPAVLPWSYATSFAVVAFLCGVACLLAAAFVLDSVDAEPGRVVFALGFIAIAPLMLGALYDTRFDLWPVALAVGALAALLRERPGLAGALLGLAFAAKLWPIVLAPLALAYAWRRWGRHAAFIGSLSFGVAAALCFVPFLVVAPGGVWHSLTDQLRRPLQVESLGASALMAAHHIGGLALTTVTTHGSQNLSGSLAGATGAASTVLELAILAAIWIAFARRMSPGGEELIVACAAAVAVSVAFSKVFSPQYLIWLVPFVPLVRGRRGLAASLLLAGALLLTQTWFSHHYWPLALDYAQPWSWLLLVRDLAVVAIALTLAWPARDALPEQRTRLAAFEAIRPRRA